MGKKRGGDVQAICTDRKRRYQCYYCGAESKDEVALIQHQGAKHFACPFCEVGTYGRLCQSLSGLVSHVRRSHRKDLEKVPGAMEGRESILVEVYGMSGIPPEILAEMEPPEPEEPAPAPPEDPAPPVPEKSPPEERLSSIMGVRPPPSLALLPLVPPLKAKATVTPEPGTTLGSLLTGATTAVRINEAIEKAASAGEAEGMSKALLAAVATNSPSSSGDADQIIEAVLRAAKASKDNEAAQAAPPPAEPQAPPPEPPPEPPEEKPREERHQEEKPRDEGSRDEKARDASPGARDGAGGHGSSEPQEENRLALIPASTKDRR
eukprot:CAMPEP_0117534992 /NCGR_PEP_ID=MMETSP0784-20121206/40700_1 /TAXON_ID=39447 /ORGANISM="" /LENGTH=321 /DNA_ID=CAMNT_0005331495 /DNA_START=58 /DNA_END=1019 /DNA_ORIENTATION=-